jgi:membrane-associated phospholipid phosphatase
MKLSVLPFVLMLSCFLSLNGQNRTDSPALNTGDTLRVKGNVSNQKVTHNGETYLQSYWTDTKGVVTHPFHWNTTEIIAASAVVGGTVGLLFFDEQINDFFERNKTEFIEKSSKYFFDPLGSGLYSIPALGIFYVSGVIWKNNKAKETALKGVEAYVITFVFTTLIKQTAHRHRPHQDYPPNPWAWEGPFQWGGPYGAFGYNSFPSGHSSLIWSIATVVSLEYWNTIWVPAVCFSLAGVTALYRCAVNVHWASDVLFGSALGYSIGALVYHNNFKKLQVLPTSETGMGATLIYHF